MEVKKVIKLPKPLPYQQQIIDYLEQDDIKYVSVCAGRQCGKSFLLKMLVTKWALEQQNQKILYITPTSKLSRNFYKELTDSLKDFIKESNGTELRITFTTGSYVQFFSSESENSIRGFQSNYLIIDEAAFINDDTFNLIIKPTSLVKGKKIIMCSTPNGAQGFFFQHVVNGLDNKKGYKTVKTNIYENQFVTTEEIENIKTQVPERVFRQEYLGEFLDNAGTVFTNYMNCLLIDKPILNNKYFAAIDWAKSHDYTVITILNSLKQVVFRYKMTGLDYTKQVEKIISILNEWKPLITISEENNIGTVVNEMLKKDYKGKLKCITLDNSFKKEIIEQLIVAFEQRLILIDNDQSLINELQGFTVTYNPASQTIKYGARTGGYDDQVISLAYAYYAASKLNQSNYSISFI